MSTVINFSPVEKNRAREIYNTVHYYFEYKKICSAVCMSSFSVTTSEVITSWRDRLQKYVCFYC